MGVAMMSGGGDHKPLLPTDPLLLIAASQGSCGLKEDMEEKVYLGPKSAW